MFSNFAENYHGFLELYEDLLNSDSSKKLLGLMWFLFLNFGTSDGTLYNFLYEKKL
jgi:hypothetical protein